MRFNLKLLKIIELLVLALFVILIAYLLITGLSSAVGLDKSWPYPQR